MRAPAFWQARRPGVVARALAPLGAIYGAATARRMALSGARVGVPVVCVGNFVVGGAGKTPTAIALARLLQAVGERVAFLSRGYGGEARAAPLKVDPIAHGAYTVGDEPLLLARVAPCYVGADRVASAAAAIQAGASVVVMDDGLQNPALSKDVSLAVVDNETRFGNGLCLPAGPLRAPLAAQTEFVDALITIGAGASDWLGAIAPGKPTFSARLRPDAMVASGLIGRPALAFAGIARPEKFFASLAAIGAQVAASRVFPDHHRYVRREIEALIAEAERRGFILTTTEKDLVRIPADLVSHMVALPVTLGFEDPDAVSRWLKSAVAGTRARLHLRR